MQCEYRVLTLILNNDVDRDIGDRYVYWALISFVILCWILLLNIDIYIGFEYWYRHWYSYWIFQIAYWLLILRIQIDIGIEHWCWDINLDVDVYVDVYYCILLLICMLPIGIDSSYWYWSQVLNTECCYGVWVLILVLHIDGDTDIAYWYFLWYDSCIFLLCIDIEIVMNFETDYRWCYWILVLILVSRLISTLIVVSLFISNIGITCCVEYWYWYWRLTLNTE